jgi:hypothetical protein
MRATPLLGSRTWLLHNEEGGNVKSTHLWIAIVVLIVAWTVFSYW